MIFYAKTEKSYDILWFLYRLSWDDPSLSELFAGGAVHQNGEMNNTEGLGNKCCLENQKIMIFYAKKPYFMLFYDF